MNRYPRGKSWNWYKRSVKRKEAYGHLWLAVRNAKKTMTLELGRSLFGYGAVKQLNNLDGLDSIIN